MENIYTGQRNIKLANNNILAKNSSLTIANLIEKNYKSISQRELIEVYCNDLNSLLKIEDLSQLIVRIFSFEDKCSELVEILSPDNNEPIFELNHFYRNLSPMILRVIMERDQDNDFSKINKDILESIRISIEEEIYFWEERLNLF